MADDKRINLGCTALQGRYPKFKTKNLPRGLKFQNGITNIYESDFEQLKSEHNDFNLILAKGEITRIKGRNPRPVNPLAPKVLRGEPASTMNMKKEVDQVQPEVDEPDETPKPTIEFGG